MNALIEKLIAIAQKEVGTLEEGGNNHGARIVEYQKATWLKPDGWPWCAAFMCWCMLEWIKDKEVQLHFNVTPLAANGLRCRDASAFGWIKWANEKGFYVTDEKELAKAGDIVVFDFSHIAIVKEDQIAGSEFIKTIEGNTNGKGERDSVTGDGVWEKTRHCSIVKNYIRMIPETQLAA